MCEEFDIRWGERVWRGRIVIAGLWVVCCICLYWYAGLTSTVLAALPLALLAWVVMPSVDCRMKFDGHYVLLHADQRPDEVSTKDVVHEDALYGWVLYSRNCFWVRTTERLLVSYEVLSQLCAPKIMRIGAESKVVHSRIHDAVGRMPSVNYSRYLALTGNNVLQNTDFVACMKYEALTRQVRKWGFVVAPAATL
jgi:hypothetical protein